MPVQQGMSLGIVRCTDCGRNYIGADCPWCSGRAPDRGPHPAEHVEGECGYCAPAVASEGGVPLEVWERAVEEKPYQARVFGPPNWLVLERAGPDAKPEKRAEVVEELRREYGPDEPIVAKTVASGAVSPADVATTCSACGQRPPQPGRQVCAGCRQAAYRERKS